MILQIRNIYTGGIVASREIEYPKSHQHAQDMARKLAGNETSEHYSFIYWTIIDNKNYPKFRGAF